MGDRAYFYVTVGVDDAESEAGEAILGIYFNGPEEKGTRSARYVEEGMNYGGCSFLEEWAAAGFLCRGGQEGGCEYGPSEFCTREGALYEIDRGRNGGYVVDFDVDTQLPDPADVGRITECLQMFKLTEEEMEKTPMERLAACAEPAS